MCVYIRVCPSTCAYEYYYYMCVRVYMEDRGSCSLSSSLDLHLRLYFEAGSSLPEPRAHLLSKTSKLQGLFSVLATFQVTEVCLYAQIEQGCRGCAPSPSFDQLSHLPEARGLEVLNLEPLTLQNL